VQNNSLPLACGGGNISGGLILKEDTNEVEAAAPPRQSSRTSKRKIRDSPAEEKADEAVFTEVPTTMEGPAQHLRESHPIVRSERLRKKTTNNLPNLKEIKEEEHVKFMPGRGIPGKGIKQPEKELAPKLEEIKGRGSRRRIPTTAASSAEASVAEVLPLRQTRHSNRRLT